MIIRTFRNQKRFIQEALHFIATIARKKRGPLSIALSGGTTPEPLYKALAAQKNIPFEKIDWYQVDERYVSLHYKDSNQKMIRNVLIKPLGKKLKTFYAFDPSLSLLKAVSQYQSLLKKKVPKGFDLVILGIGPDGHTASLFPASKVLKEKRQWVASTTTHQFVVRNRLTLTFPALLQSKNILVLLKGAEKKSLLQKLQHPPKNVAEFPAKALLKHSSLLVYFLSQ